MRCGGKIFSLVLFLGVLGSSGSARAYDVDVHFYLTYLLSRYVGISHPVALQLAIGAEYVDESRASSPMMAVPSFHGAHLRRIFHFPGNPRTSTNEASLSSMGKQLPLRFLKMKNNVSGVRRFRYWTLAVEEHPMAFDFMRFGFRIGSLLVVAGGIHPLEDSFGHEGFTAELGHAEFGHTPDRPWYEMNKYRRMVTAVIKTLVSIRQRLPASALDSAFSDGDRPNAQASAEELVPRFLGKSDFFEMVGTDTLKQRAYIEPALRYLTQQAARLGYFLPQLDLNALLPGAEAFDGTRDTNDLLIEMVLKVMEKEFQDHTPYINHRLVEQVLLQDEDSRLFGRYREGKTVEERRERVLSLVQRAVRTFTEGYIPVPFSDTVKVAAEADGVFRDREMSMRILNMRKYIDKLFHQNILYEPRHKFRQKLREWIFRSTTTPQETLPPSVAYAEELDPAFDRAAERVRMDRPWTWAWQATRYALRYYVRPFSERHQMADRRAKAPLNPEAFNKLIETGYFKMIANDEDVRRWNRAHQARVRALMQSGARPCEAKVLP